MVTLFRGRKNTVMYLNIIFAGLHCSPLEEKFYKVFIFSIFFIKNKPLTVETLYIINYSVYTFLFKKKLYL